VDLGEVEETVAKWDLQIQEQQKIGSIARQEENTIRNRKLELAKTLRALADEIDPPNRGRAVS
jgi:hypothetical protein